MGLARILGFCVAFLFASSVVSAATIDLGPSDYRNFGPNGSHTGSGIRSSTGQTVRIPPAGGNLTVNRNPIVPYNSVANGLKNFVRITPGSILASAAVTGIFIAVDFVFDSDQGEWGKIGDDVIDEDAGLSWYNQNISGSWPSPELACRGVTDRFGSSYSYSHYTISQSGTSGQCFASYQGQPPIGIANINRSGNCQPPSIYNPEIGACTIDGEWVRLDDSDFQNLENRLPSLPASEVAQAAGDTQRMIGNPLPGYSDTSITGPSSFTGPGTTSTSTDPVTGDTIVTNTSNTTNISYGDTTITTSTTTTSTTYQNGQQTSTTVITETPGELPVSTGDWPGFCDWATVVCDWLNWTQEDSPPDVDLPPVIDDDFFEQKNISFGAKSCPPDYEVNLTPFLATSVGVSFQPLCDFAGLIYYMVMAASYIIAAYISIGVARNA